MKVAVCALAWNEGKVTREFIESVQRNSGGHQAKTFIIDNGSSDGCATHQAAKLADWSKRYDQPENLAIGYNDLFGATVDGDWDVICLANNDMLVGPGWLDPIEREFAKDPKRYFLPNDCLKNPSRIDQDTLDGRPAAETRPALAGWCLFFTPEAVKVFMPIPEGLKLWYCDSWIHGHLKRAGYKCEVVMDSCTLHYGSLSFYKHPTYVQSVAEDRELYNRLTGENL